MPTLEASEARTLLSTFTVTSLADDNHGVGNSGDLRYVINRANMLDTGTPRTPDIIQFTGVTLTPSNHTIHIGAGAGPLPALADIAIVDGATATDFDNATGLMLELDGSLVSGAGNGLILKGGYSTVEGLEIVNFPGDGIRVASSHNTIGGDVVGVNGFGQPNNPAGRMTSPLPPTPVPKVLVRPPLGNVISGNGGDGVRIEGNKAQSNVLEGNFIGTDVTGTAARGNRGDGVAIIHSNNNQLLGTTPPDKNNPFVFYNVISGNGGNGLVVDDSNSTTIYANFFGLGADDSTPVGNHRDGVLIEGRSDLTTFGGNIPLGNVTSANGGNGLEIRDSASRTISGNTFGGVAAFNPSAQVGNGGDGILVTSTGGGKVFGRSSFSTIILTNQESDNGRNGIEIAGNATGVQVSQSIVGLDTDGKNPEPNGQDGIEIHGNASAVSVGGFEPSVAGVPENNSFVEAANLISGNRRIGVDIEGNTRRIKIVNSMIGTDISGQNPAANGRDGLLIAGSSKVHVGSAIGTDDPRDLNIIAFNASDGVEVVQGKQNGILGNSIFGNGHLGIDLVLGGNRDQPAPVLTSAVEDSASGTTRVSGTLTASPSSTYQVEVFDNHTPSAGSGQSFLGFLELRTNAAGVAPFVIAGLKTPDPTDAEFLAATATSRSGDTSMFSGTIEANP